jgi:hypothetical protein
VVDAINVSVPIALSIIGVAGVGGALLYFLRVRDLKGAGFLGILGVAALILTRLPDITLFSMLGVSAELRHTIDEANAKIAQLRELAVAVAEPELSQLAMSGVMFSQLSFSYRNERKIQIVMTLKSLGVPQAEIDRALEVWNDVTLRMLSNVIMQALIKTAPDVGEKFKSIRLDSDEKSAKPTALKSFLSENHVTDAEVSALIDDYDHLFATGDVRHPDKFPVGIQP